MFLIRRRWRRFLTRSLCPQPPSLASDPARLEEVSLDSLRGDSSGLRLDLLDQ